MAKTTRKNYRGGSASSWMANKVGDMSAQVNKALNPASKTNTLTGGRRRRSTKKRGGAKRTKKSSSSARRRTRRRSGGFLGGVLSSAIVPFGLWGAQRRMARRVKRGKK
jgi:hypothetical protein